MGSIWGYFYKFFLSKRLALIPREFIDLLERYSHKSLGLFLVYNGTDDK